MFLTKLTLDPAAYRPRRLLGDTQQLHAALSASFPAGEGGRLLWRVEPAHDRDVLVLVASPGGPDEAELSERITNLDRVETRPYKRLLDRIEKGHRFRFRATLNPVRTRDGHQTPLVGREDQISWVVRKLGTNGAQVCAHSADLDVDEPDVQITSVVQDRFGRRGHTGSVELLKVTFDGSLTVSDPDALRHALCHGVGRGKGYGCGLLTLAPI